MIERTHCENGIDSWAWFSTCGAYRYGLQRVWNATGPRLLFVMLNPSTADEMRNDPTIERCQRRASALGFGSVSIANLFAFRATRPRDLKRSAEPEGAENAASLKRCVAGARMVIAAWGVHGAYLGAGPRFSAGLAAPLYHLGLTRNGHPRHPLYVPYDVEPKLWPRWERTP